jgi:hypothetical protein
MHDERRQNRRERRAEAREPLAARIQWRMAGSEQTRTGWVSDQSRSSVSFVSTVNDSLPVNQEIEVIRPAGPLAGLFRVMRVTDYGSGSLIACKAMV